MFKKMNKEFKSNALPLLPLRDIVVFPGMVAPLFVGRAKSIGAIGYVLKNNSKILLVTQKDSSLHDPKSDQMYSYGVTASVLQLLKLPDGTVKVLVEGVQRVKVREYLENDNYHIGVVEYIDEVSDNKEESIALMRSVFTQFAEYSKLNKKISPEILASLEQIQDPSRLSDVVCAHLNMPIEQKQKLLEDNNVISRLEKVFIYIESEIEKLNTEQKIRKRVKSQVEKSQREYYLKEQLNAINKELADGDGNTEDEIKVLEEKINKTKLSKEAIEKALSELKKLKNMPAMSAEATVIRNYLDWMLSLPWKKNSSLQTDLNKAKAILDNDHYGLEKVKERILEYIAVSQRTKQVKGPILCLIGPPGVGKTSLAKSIADAVNRKFAKISLGGVRDESEIRGHRRTYIGSMPGKILQSMKKAKTSNPILLLDEIDKMGSDHRGDPASALLEVLDSEQNTNFNDHYLEVDYDLSKVMFVATANSTNIPYALHDRLEIIRISGYTEDEKVEICKRHLIPKLIKDHGLKKGELTIGEEALRHLIKYYTREAGVRSLEREIANISRKVVRKILMKDVKKVQVTDKNLEKYSGVRKFQFGETEDEDMVGIVSGLAYTEVGGDILTIEAVALPGKGEIKSTGKLGEVMQESAQAAYSYFKSNSSIYGVIQPKYQKKDIHIHVPEGATPKDGPSAGVAMFVSIVSVMTGIRINKNVAMTGEITLRGRVLAIGGLKEKLLAALRGGIKTVLIPKENEKDMVEIPDNVKEGLNIVYVSHADEVIKVALVEEPKAVSWSEESIADNQNVKVSDSDILDEVVTH